MSFNVKIEPEAKKDIQQGISWYNTQKKDLGHKFYSEVLITFEKLKTNPYFQIRYDEVRCLPLKNFPFMIHYSVKEEENSVIVHAVFNTSRKPKK